MYDRHIGNARKNNVRRLHTVYVSVGVYVFVCVYMYVRGRDGPLRECAGEQC